MAESESKKESSDERFEYWKAIGLFQENQGVENLLAYIEEERNGLLKVILTENATNVEWKRAQATALNSFLDEVNKQRTKYRKQVEGSAKGVSDV